MTPRDTIFPKAYETEELLDMQIYIFLNQNSKNGFVTLLEYTWRWFGNW